MKAAFPILPPIAGDPYLRDAILALSSTACIAAPYPDVLAESDIDPETENDFGAMNDLVRAIRNIRTEMQISPSEKTELYFSGSKTSAEWEQASTHREIILSLTPTSQIIFSEHEPTFFGASALWGGLKLTIPIPETLKAKERLRLEKEKGKLVKMREGTEEKLANVGFRNRAPQEVVAKLEQNLAQTNRQLDDIIHKLKKLAGC